MKLNKFKLSITIGLFIFLNLFNFAFAGSFHNLLKDPENKISKDFKMKTSLKWRTQFWFDVYTKYTDKDHVLHHSQFPWVIFEVINTQHIFNTKINYFTKHYRADKYVKKRKTLIYKTLIHLSKRKNYKLLNSLEKKLYKALKYVRGKRSRVFRVAAKSLRKQLGQKTFFKKGLKNSTKYLTHMEVEFRRLGLPIELTRIPFVESSFNEKAHSKVGASGIWQIMPRTGREFLRVEKYIDERNSPIKATRIAAIQLKRNYKILDGQWPLAVTAYNHGVGGMKKAIRQVKSKKIEKLITKYRSKSFKFASKNFYTSFVAALHAQMYRDQIFDNLETEPLSQFLTLKIKKPIRIKSLLKKYQLTTQDFIAYNLDLKKAIKRNIRLPIGLLVYLPKI